jgi:RNA polymerase sigma-70 factor (ECF subfamily)
MAGDGEHLDEVTPAKQAQFTTTHWSVVLAAGQDSSPAAREALERLCRTYWYPLYAYARRQGCGPEDAEDLTQEFFARLLAHRDLESVRREKGRFRSYLMVSLKHFLINEWKRNRTGKRGGRHIFIPLDQALAEDFYSREPADTQTAEKIFERRWATTTLEHILILLEKEYAASGRARQYGCLKGFLSDEKNPRTQSEIAVELGISEGAVKQAVHRMRQRYRELLREQIAHTVAAAGDVEDELRHLIAALRS